MIVFPVQIYYNYGYKEPFFVTFYTVSYTHLRAHET